MAKHKPRAIREQRHTTAKHRKALKAAQRRNQGDWSGYSGEQKRNAVKAAFKASFTMTPDLGSQLHLLPSMVAQTGRLILPDWLKKPVYDQPQPLPELKSWTKGKAA